MKESKLMKEVVQRSVQPDLDLISSRILAEHEGRIENRMARVRSHYFSAAVACVGLVFILGLVMGLLIMRGAMKRDLEPNTAPEIISPGSSSPSVTNSTAPGVSDTDERIYLGYKNKRFYSGTVNTDQQIDTITSLPVDERILRFLSDQLFIGFVDNENVSRSTYLTSNFLPQGTAVFKNKGEDTFYAYTTELLYLFGNTETLAIEGYANYLELVQSALPDPMPAKPLIVSFGSINLVYDQASLDQSSFDDQEQFFFSSSHMLVANSNTVFLGMVLKNGEYGIGVRSSEILPPGSAVFYNTVTNELYAVDPFNLTLGISFQSLAP